MRYYSRSTYELGLKNSPVRHLYRVVSHDHAFGNVFEDRGVYLGGRPGTEYIGKVSLVPTHSLAL